MCDTLLPGDYVLVARCAYGLALPFGGPRLPLGRRPGRGDIVVFRAPDRPGECLVKRCVATPGETVAIVNKHIIVGGDTLIEPAAHHGDAAVHPADYDARDNLAPVTLEPGQLFVLGDNRDDSEDSRFWGPVPEDGLIGRAILVYWSWDDRQGRPRWERILRPLR
jgi:signal peptidase I